MTNSKYKLIDCRRFVEYDIGLVQSISVNTLYKQLGFASFGNIEYTLPRDTGKRIVDLKYLNDLWYLHKNNLM